MNKWHCERCVYGSGRHESFCVRQIALDNMLAYVNKFYAGANELRDVEHNPSTSAE